MVLLMKLLMIIFFCKNVQNISFVQENESMSSYGVLRGLHFQLPPFSQSKLVRVIQGSILNVSVDLRRKSATFGKYFSIRLSDNNKQLFIPRGFAHGFISFSEHTIVNYKCDNYYCKDSESGIAWNDPELNIDWEIDSSKIIMSEKDLLNPYLKDIILKIITI